MLVSVEFCGEEFGFGCGVFCSYGARFSFENVVIRMAKMRCPDIKLSETNRAFDIRTKWPKKCCKLSGEKARFFADRVSQKEAYRSTYYM